MINAFETLNKYGAKITGSTALQIFENVYFGSSDIDIFVDNEETGRQLIKALVDIHKFKVKKYDNAHYAYSSFAMKPIGLVGSVTYRHNIKIDILDIQAGGVGNYDLDICANYISLDGKDYKFTNVNSLLTRKAKFLHTFKKDVAKKVKFYAYHKDRALGIHKEELSDTLDSMLKNKLYTTQTRMHKYEKRGYTITDSYLEYVPQDQRDILFREQI